jgi:hypothetical protein
VAVSLILRKWSNILAVAVVLVFLFSFTNVSIGENVVKKPLNELTFNLDGAASTRPSVYDWRSIRHKGPTEESNEYASLVTSTNLDKGSIVLHDKIIVAPENVQDMPKNFSLIFDRTVAFAGNNLLVPKAITIDMSSSGKTFRQFSYEHGVAKHIDEDGENGTEHLDFSDGILSFNALLRLTPLLPRVVGDTYTFRQYAEPLLFRMHMADKSDPVFTLRCESLESIKIGKRSHECFKFELELKSALIKTDLWVDKTSNLVVKFSDDLPEGADADRLEATLVE